MFGKTFMSVSVLLGLATAQSAPGFPFSPKPSLNISYGDNTVSPPGELIPRGETAQPPTIFTPVWYSDENGPTPGVLLMVDLDVPRNGTRVQLLHWLATNVTLGNRSTADPLNIPVGAVPYLQPSPPVGDIPHSYTFIVFPQPANFSIPTKYAGLAQNRVGFNVSQFVTDAGLASPLAANYIRVQNLTGVTGPATTFPPARSTETTTSNSSAPVMFPGAATPVFVGGATVWAGLVTALLAGVAAIAL